VGPPLAKRGSRTQPLPTRQNWINHRAGRFSRQFIAPLAESILVVALLGGQVLKIAYLVNQYPRTGMTFIRREIHAMEAHGIEVIRFSLRPLGFVPRDSPSLGQNLPNEVDQRELERTRVLLDAGVAAYARAILQVALRRPRSFARATATAIRLGWRSDRGLPRHAAYLAEACLLSRWLGDAGAEHVHAHFGTNSTTVALLCHELDGPGYSFTVHGPEEFDRPEALKLREKVRRAAFAVAVCKYGRAQILRWARFEDWSKVHIVHCGVDEALLRESPSPVPTAPRFVCVGRLSEQKGHLVLLEAAAQLAREGTDFEIVIVGDGPLRGEIERRIRRHGLLGRVRILGWLGAAQVRQEIVAARALVLPSFAEGLPVAVMEAFALGRPVITTSIAGTPELVEEGVSGWLLPAADVQALAAALRAASEASPAQLQRMGRAGAERVAREHDVNSETKKLVALFRSAAAGVRRDIEARSSSAERGLRESA